nr:Chain P, Amiloride-sensitive sodium channel subunit alpha [Homo sapiens]
TAPPPAYATLG